MSKSAHQLLYCTSTKQYIGPTVQDNHVAMTCLQCTIHTEHHYAAIPVGVLYAKAGTKTRVLGSCPKTSGIRVQNLIPDT